MKKTILLAIVSTVVLVVIAVLLLIRCGADSNSARKEYPFLYNIIESGNGTVRALTSDPDRCDGLFKADELSKDKIGLAHIIGISNTIVTKKNMADLAGATTLSTLSFGRCDLDGAIFDPLTDTPVESLYFQQCRMTNETGQSVTKLKKLENLYFIQMEFPEHFFKHCRSLPVRSLAFIDTPIVSSDLTDMLPLPELSEICLKQTRINDDITAFFDALPKLENIEIIYADIRCEFMRDMKNIYSLRTIRLWDVSFPDEILPAIDRFTRLSSVFINSSELTVKSIPVAEGIANNMYRFSLRGELFSSFNANNYYKPVHPPYHDPDKNSATGQGDKKIGGE